MYEPLGFYRANRGMSGWPQRTLSAADPVGRSARYLRHERAHRAACVQHEQVPIYVELREDSGRPVRGMPDPSGGTFDAAGDFDRFVNESYFGHPSDLKLSALPEVDPYANTEMHADRMAALLDDLAQVLSLAKSGPERRGLMRLQVMAELCAGTPGSVMVWLGD